MNNLKNWTILVLTVSVLSLAGAYKITKDKLREEKSDNARLSLNQERLLKQDKEKNIQIELTKKEFKDLIKEKDDSLKLILYKLNIKPEKVIQYVDRTFSEKITAPKVIPLSLVSKNTWQLKDETPCMKYYATVFLIGDSLRFRRDLFSYENKTLEFLSREKKGKFLFWDTYYKNRYILTDTSRCGDTRSRTINVIK